MLALAAVQPDGLGILDHDGVDGDHAVSLASVYGLESGVDALDAGVDIGDGYASIVEGGLSDGVVASPELELHHSTRLGLDLVGPELEASLVIDGVHANRDDLDIGSWKCG